MQKISVSPLINSPLLPRITALLRWLSETPGSFRSEHPFEIFDYGISKNFGIKNLNKIAANTFVMGVSTTHCITGLELVNFISFFFFFKRKTCFRSTAVLRKASKSRKSQRKSRKSTIRITRANIITR